MWAESSIGTHRSTRHRAPPTLRASRSPYRGCQGTGNASSRFALALCVQVQVVTLRYVTLTLRYVTSNESGVSRRYVTLRYVTFNESGFYLIVYGDTAALVAAAAIN